MAILKHINELVEIAARKGIRYAVLCPGSRSAALTIAFARHQDINAISIADERSAGFIALGIAQITKIPTVLVCTSGTAAYNFAPAVAEAYFQGIPLIVLTADRPPEWIHQYDGQTIFQGNIFGKHVKKSFELPVNPRVEDEFWHNRRIINEALNLAITDNPGPVHINIPIREPFYPDEEEDFTFPDAKIINKIPVDKVLSENFWQDFLDKIDSNSKILLVAGQNQKLYLTRNIGSIAEKYKIPLVSEIISNISGETINTDIFINALKIHDVYPEDLSPDILITCGKSILSKNFKNFLRKNKPKYHYHIQEIEELIDPFQSLTHQVNVSQEYFFDELSNRLTNITIDANRINYYNSWNEIYQSGMDRVEAFIENLHFSEFKSVDYVLKNIPDNSIVHLANSMVVRYANILGLPRNKNIEIFSNRGTSGIDGSFSSAVGNALVSDSLVTLLIGDLSFFYDRNAVWNNLKLNNLRIVLFNNRGGNIFKIIDGPANLPEVKIFFETEQNYNAQHLCEEANINYYLVNDNLSLTRSLDDFFQYSDRPKLIEIMLNGDENVEIFKKFKQIFL